MKNNHPDEQPTRPFDINNVRLDFPILAQQINGSSLAYFDNGATAQKPNRVIDSISNYYQTTNSNVHRGAHYLSDLATQKFEQARSTLQSFINAPSREEIIWTRGTTESINLVAQTWGASNIKRGDEIIVSTLEHHSNIVPWQMLCERVGASLKVIDVAANGQLNFKHFESLINEKTALVAVGHISNALGVINPVKKMIAIAHKYGAKILIDGAQAAPHLCIDVQELDCDFYALSGHKMFGPMGIGILYGKKDILDAMPPWQFGGEMIEQVTFDSTTFNQLPYKFEAGTPNVAGAVGLAAAVDYLSEFNRADLAKHESELLSYASKALENIEGLKIIGYDCEKASVISFNIDGCHSQDLGMMLDQQGIAVRTGHHCTMPLMNALGLSGTVRVSFSFYNTFDEIDRLIIAIGKAKNMLL